MQFPDYAEIKSALAERGVTAFSFDVFDTFLLRRCTSPDGVFDRAYQLASLTGQGPGGQTNFHTHRQMAEIAARKRAARDRVHEVTINEIYRRFPVRAFGLGDADRAALVEAEFAAECDLCFVNDHALELYRALRADGIKVGFISDIYWSGEQLARLLRHCVPGLEWDFLYASSDYGVGKSSGLFERYLRQHKLAAGRAAHIGDNIAADIVPARELGMTTFHCPQCSPSLAATAQRELHAFGLFCRHQGAGLRLDSGLLTLRRRVAAHLGDVTPARRLGATVMGPVMAAFDRFVAEQVRALEATPTADGGPRRVAVAFLARDGLQSLKIWRAMGHGPASYVAINRRIALTGGMTGYDELVHFFTDVPALECCHVEGFLKHSFPSVRAYFRRQPKGWVTGKTFAKALPDLLSQSDLLKLAAATRRRLMTYLHREMPEFDACTDLVLVDVGYSGTVQKALRTMFDAEGLTKSLHGVYMIAAEEAFWDLDPRDTVAGMVADHVIDPHVNIALRSNVALLEQICSAPEGSVSDYTEDGTVIREADPRDPEQLALCEEIRQGAMDFVEVARTLVTQGWADPLADLRQSLPSVAAILARLLLMPSDNDLALLGRIKLDVNLGSQVQLPLVDPVNARHVLDAMPMINAFGINTRVLWPAASLTSVSPLHGYLYPLFAARHLPGDVFADAPCGELSVIAVNGNNPIPLQVTCARTADGALRIRLPIPNPRVAGNAVLLPMNDLPPGGVLRGMMLQKGSDAKHAFDDREPVALPLSAVVGQGVDLRDDHYIVTAGDAHLLFMLPPVDAAVVLFTLTIIPQDGARLLAVNGDTAVLQASYAATTPQQPKHMHRREKASRRMR